MLSKIFIERLILLIIGGYITYYISLNLLEKSFNLENDANVTVPKHLNLNNHEKHIYSMLIKSENITTDFSHVKGLDETKHILINRIIKPLKDEKLMKNKLLKPPNGVILYGKPGTGKTMLVKALCKEANINFINFSINLIENKLFGESSKIINALFTLADKIKPAVIFIDEIDGFFSKRCDLDQSFVNNLKTFFYSKMDGIFSCDDSIIFIGATNRLHSIDDAMLRRMRLHLHIDLPNWEARQTLFEEHLKAIYPKYDFADIEEISEGLSCCDIEEICKAIGFKSYNFDTNKFEENKEHIVNTILEFSEK